MDLVRKGVPKMAFVLAVIVLLLGVIFLVVGVIVIWESSEANIWLGIHLLQIAAAFLIGSGVISAILKIG